MRFIALAAVLALLGSAAHAAPTPVDFATISMTTAGEPRTVSDTVCVTDGRDLTCDRGVYVTPAGRVGIGNPVPHAVLTVDMPVPAIHGVAIRVSGSGELNLMPEMPYDSGWNLISKAGDQAIVGKAQGIVSSAISIIPWSNKPSGLRIEATGRIGAHKSNPSTALDISGTLRFSDGLEGCDADRTGAIRYSGGDFSFCRNGSAWETLTSLGGGGGQSDRITSGTSAVVVNSATGIVSISQLGAVASYVHPSLGYVGPGVSATGTVSGSKVATNVVKFSGATGSCATAADEGTFFYDIARKRLQVCSLRN